MTGTVHGRAPTVRWWPLGFSVLATALGRPWCRALSGEYLGDGGVQGVRAASHTAVREAAGSRKRRQFSMADSTDGTIAHRPSPYCSLRC
jgi:hypothetical protein